MENRRTWKVALVILLAAAGLWAQQQATALRPPELSQLLDDAATLLKNLSLTRSSEYLEKNRQRIQGNFTPEIYGFVSILHGVAAELDLASGQASAADRTRLHEIADKLDTHFRALIGQREQQLRARNADRDNLARYGDADRQLGPAAAGEQRVVFMGDSITDFWKLTEYFPGKPWVNRGISGQITGEMLGRMKADVLDLKPAAMLVLAGTNDLARGVTVEGIENNFTMIGTLAKSAGIKVIFASILPVSTQTQITARPPDKIVQLNDWLTSYCKNEGFTYLDYHSSLKDEKGLLRSDLANDGLHPNAAGYKIMAPLAEAAISKILQPEPKKGKKKK